MRSVLDAVTQHVDRASFRDLSLQPRQKLPPCRAVLVEVQRFNDAGLCLPQKGRKLHEIHAILAVVVIRRAADPAGALCVVPFLAMLVGTSTRITGRTCQRHTYQTFECSFGGVGGHVIKQLSNNVDSCNGSLYRKLLHIPRCHLRCEKTLIKQLPWRPEPQITVA